MLVAEFSAKLAVVPLVKTGAASTVMLSAGLWPLSLPAASVRV